MKQSKKLRKPIKTKKHQNFKKLKKTQKYKNLKKRKTKKYGGTLTEKDNPTCPICTEEIVDNQGQKFSPNCLPGHLFHPECIRETKEYGHRKCPYCRKVNIEENEKQEKAYQNVIYAKRAVDHYRADLLSPFWVSSMKKLIKTLKNPYVPIRDRENGKNNYLRNKISLALEHNNNSPASIEEAIKLTKLIDEIII